MRVAIALIVGAALGVGGTLGFQALDNGGGETSQEDITTEVARVATQRDDLDVGAISCAQKPFPENVYECEVETAAGNPSYSPYHYRVTVNGNSISVDDGCNALVRLMGC